MNPTAYFKILVTMLFLTLPETLQAKSFFPSRLTPVVLQTWIAPFDAVFERVPPARGTPLAVGDIIGTLQSHLLSEKVVLLQHELLRTELALAQRSKWSESSEVLSAQMQVFQSESQKKQACDKYDKHTPLYKKGLISEEEREGQRLQCEQGTRYAVLANKQLDMVLKEGEGDKIEQLQQQYHLLKAQEKLLLEMHEQLTGTAAVYGLWWPAEELGIQVAASHDVGAIVDAHKWSLPIMVDEHERLHINLKQPVKVQITSFKDQVFDGEVTYLDANPNFEGSQLARYNGYVTVEIPEAFKQDWFFGMRATVIIDD